MSDNTIPSLLNKLLYNLSEESYDHTFSTYCFWIELGAAHEGMPNDKLFTDIRNGAKPGLLQASYEELTNQRNTRPDWINPFAGQELHYNTQPSSLDAFCGRLIHDNVPLLLRFISDAELDPVLSTYAVGLHDRWCRGSLQGFFRQSLHYIPGARPISLTSHNFCQLYTGVNLIAHWVNLGYVQLEDVRDRILQSLTFQPTVHPHQLNSLMILLKISGATFAAYVDPSIMDRCCALLKPSNLGSKQVATGLAEVRMLILAIKMSFEC